MKAFKLLTLLKQLGLTLNVLKDIIKDLPRKTWMIVSLVCVGLVVVLFLLSPSKDMPSKSAENQVAGQEIDYTPKFDIVRVENGKAVIAGRTAPDAVVHIMSGDREIGQEKADERGEFVFLPEKDFTAGTYELSLWVKHDGEKMVSTQNAILTIDSESDETVAVLVDGKKKAKVLQAPKGDEIGQLKVATVEYNFKDTFRVGGYGKAGTKVNVYLNSKFVDVAKVDSDGTWDLEVEKTLTQDRAYKLRADMIDDKGKVIARVQNKFSTDRYDGDAKTYVVKSGDCLWRIARREYGRGIDYILIFKANKSQIKDPDLIYPNQVFKVPTK